MPTSNLYTIIVFIVFTYYIFRELDFKNCDFNYKGVD